MNKLLFIFLISICLLSLIGCKTIRNTAVGAGVITKGLVDDTYDTYKAIEEADRWFRENCW
jgi:hypothetical protein